MENSDSGIQFWLHSCKNKYNRDIHEEDTGLQYAAAVRDDGMLGFLASGFSARRLEARGPGALRGDQAG